MKTTEIDLTTPNIFELMAERFSSGIVNETNVLGASTLSFENSYRKVVFNKIFKPVRVEKMTTLFGTINHQICESKWIRTKIVEHINNQLGFKGNESTTEQEYRIEVLPGLFVRMHPDVETPNYIIEIKTKAVGLRATNEKGESIWVKEGAPQNVNQLNTYTVYRGKKIGILFVINIMAFVSKSVDFQRILNDYTFIMKFDPNPEAYEDTIERAKTIFRLIDEKNFNCQCPTYTWECNYCDCKEKCKNPITSMKLDYEDECSNCGTTLSTKYVDMKGKNRNTHVFWRNEVMYCKSEECTEACLNAWEV